MSPTGLPQAVESQTLNLFILIKTGATFKLKSNPALLDSLPVFIWILILGLTVGDELCD